MSQILKPDICVIGAGSGGLSVAAAAASFGVSVVLIEKDKMGGDCLNYGCVPSKALLAAAKQAHTMDTGSKYGLKAAKPAIDFGKVHDYVHSVIAEIAPNDSEERFQSLGVEVIRAEAKFINKRAVEAGGVQIRARRFVIATGSEALIPSIPGIEDAPYLTNKTLFSLTEAPRRLIIIGGGPIGMEMAQAHHRLGAEVTVLEGLKALGKDDPELAEIVLEKLRQEGITVHEGAAVTQVEKADAGIRVTFKTGGREEKITGTHLLIAAGRKASLKGLGLDKAGVKYDKAIQVSRSLCTSNRRVYAIGDAIGGLQFTHMANYHAGLVIRAILFRLPVKEKRAIIPWVTFTDPELAMVGLDEKAAEERHSQIRILRWPYAENDRAQAEGKTDGLIKVITTARGKILGAGVVGLNAGEIINMWSLAIAKGMNVRDLANYVSPYPTVSEISKRAAISHFAGAAQNKWVRRLLAFLRWFG